MMRLRKVTRALLMSPSSVSLTLRMLFSEVM